DDPNTALISEGQFGLMFDDMLSSGKYDQQKMEAMLRRAAEGKAIGGILGRHPFTGQYSLQPVNFKVLWGVKEPVVSIPTFDVDLKLAGESESRSFRMSTLVGNQGDLDADNFAAYLVSPDLSEKIRSQFTVGDNEAKA